MKKSILLCLALMLSTFSLQAQFQVNPQFGLNTQDISSPPAGTNVKRDVGIMTGIDFRIGRRLYFQPGIFYIHSASIIRSKDSLGLTIEEGLLKSTVKLKGHLGLKVINAPKFRFRLMGGPSYDFLLTVDTRNNKIDFSKDDFNQGFFNLDGAAGLDIGKFTIEGGVSYGITKAFKADNSFYENPDAKFVTYQLTIGFLLGKPLL